MSDRTHIVSRTLENKIAMAENDGDHALIATLDALKAILATLKEQEEEIKALRLLVEWATECDFGFNQFPDEYELYKDEIKEMNYIDGMIHIAKRVNEVGY